MKLKSLWKPFKDFITFTKWRNSIVKICPHCGSTKISSDKPIKGMATTRFTEYCKKCNYRGFIHKVKRRDLDKYKHLKENKVENKPHEDLRIHQNPLLKILKSPLLYFILSLVFLLIFVIIISQKPFDEDLMTSRYCEQDEDCIIPQYGNLNCCPFCGNIAINQEANTERERWQKTYCSSLYKMTNKERWQCKECETPGYLAMEILCINNMCEMRLR